MCQVSTEDDIGNKFARILMFIFTMSIAMVAIPSLAPLARDSYDADSLTVLCDSENSIDQAKCEGYLMAVGDEHFIFCSPSTVDSAHLRQAYLEYAEVKMDLKEWRSKQFVSAVTTVQTAFREIFHCLKYAL